MNENNLSSDTKTRDYSHSGRSLASRQLRWKGRRARGKSLPTRRSDAPVRAKREELEFLPAALEIIETPVSPTFRITSFALCGLCVLVIAWSCLARVDMVAVAPGKVVPLGQVKVIQPLETSAVRAIHVDDGDHVVKGELLVELDPTDVKADLKQLVYDHGQAALDAEVARLLLTLNPKGEFHAPADAPSSLAEANHNEAIAEIVRFQAEMKDLDQQIKQQDAALKGNVAQQIRARETLPLLSEKSQSADYLWAKGAGVRPAVLDSHQAVIEKQAELDEAKADSVRLVAQKASLESKLEVTRASFFADANSRLTKALQKLADLEQQIAKAQRREAYRRLVAPVSGTIQGVKIHTPGAVVTTADTLMTLVPDDAGIEIEALVENKDIGFVQEGQPVEIKFDAFPFTLYGLVKGRVRKLGRDAATPQQAAEEFGAAASKNTADGTSTANAQSPSASDLSYPARVTLDRDWIMIDGRREAIRPGMRVSAEIKTGDRRVISYVLAPVMEAVREAGRER